MAKRNFKPCVQHKDGSMSKWAACGSVAGAMDSINCSLKADTEFKTGTHMNQRMVDDYSPIVATWIENKETGEIINREEYTPWK